jgi:hypothetical protein
MHPEAAFSDREHEKKRLLVGLGYIKPFDRPTTEPHSLHKPRSALYACLQTIHESWS